MTRNITISATKKMEGWGTGKIAVIGRSQDKRVVPFANMLEGELGIPVLQIKEWPNWHANLTVAENQQWIKQLKDIEYRIYNT